MLTRTQLKVQSQEQLRVDGEMVAGHSIDGYSNENSFLTDIDGHDGTESLVSSSDDELYEETDCPSADDELYEESECPSSEDEYDKAELKRSKRRKFSKIKRAQSQTRLLNLPYDVFVDNIFPLLDTADLFNLRISHRMFLSYIDAFDPDNEMSWKTWKIPIDLKDHWNYCKGGVTKRQFAKTAIEFVRHICGCQRCGAKRVRKYYWEFAIRVCTECLNDLTERDYLLEAEFDLPSGLPKIAKWGWSAKRHYYCRHGYCPYNIYLKSSVMSFLRVDSNLPDAISSLEDARSFLVERRRQSMVQYCQSLEHPISEAELEPLKKFEAFNLEPVGYSSNWMRSSAAECLAEFEQSKWAASFKREINLNERRRRIADQILARRNDMIRHCSAMQEPLDVRVLDSLSKFRVFNNLPYAAAINTDSWVRSFQQEAAEAEQRRQAEAAKKEQRRADFLREQQRLQEIWQISNSWSEARKGDMIQRCSTLSPPLKYDDLKDNPAFNEFLKLNPLTLIDYDDWIGRILACYPKTLEDVLHAWREAIKKYGGKFKYHHYKWHTGRELYEDLALVGHNTSSWMDLYRQYIEK